MAALVNIPPCRGSHMENVLLIQLHPWLGLISLGGWHCRGGPLRFPCFIFILPSTKYQVARRRRSTEPPGSVTLFKLGTVSATSICSYFEKKNHSDQIHLRKIPNRKKKVPRELRSKDNFWGRFEKKLDTCQNVAKEAKALECQSCCPLLVVVELGGDSIVMAAIYINSCTFIGVYRPKSVDTGRHF